MVDKQVSDPAYEVGDVALVPAHHEVTPSPPHDTQDMSGGPKETVNSNSHDLRLSGEGELLPGQRVADFPRTSPSSPLDTQDMSGGPKEAANCNSDDLRLCGEDVMEPSQSGVSTRRSALLEEQFLLDPGRFSSYLDEVASLPITVRFYTGELHLITEGDLEKLAEMFCSPDLIVKDMMLYFRDVFSCSEEMTDSLRHCMEALSDNEGFSVSIHVFLENLAVGRSLSKAIKRLQSLMIGDRRVENTVESNFTRKKLVNWVGRKIDQDDGLITLPTTLLYLVAFYFCVMGHFRIWERRAMGSSLTKWMKRPPGVLLGPFIDEHVNNPASFRSWLDVSALPATYGLAIFDGSSTLGISSSADVVIRTASHSALVGDVSLEAENRNGEKQKAWFMGNDAAVAFLEVNPGDFLGAARASLANMDNRGFFDDDTHRLELSICFYNGEAEMYGMVSIDATFNDFGLIVPNVDVFIIMTDLFAHKGVYVADCCFVFFILWIFFNEGYEAIASLRHGFRHFIDYLGPLNIIDWAGVFFGCLSCAVWVFVGILLADNDLCLPLSTEGKDDFAKCSLDKPNLLSLDGEQTGRLHDALRNLHLWMIMSQIVGALNTIFVVLKLFKGFQSNGRLKVVTHTLWAVRTDVCHFFIVFFPVFLVFVLMGHVLFGPDLPEFQSIPTAINTCFIALMGDFGWYTDLFGGFIFTMPSGLPKLVIVFWYITYMFFVLLVLLNMLLGIVLSQYTVSHREIAHNAVTLYDQMRQFVKMKFEMRGHIPLVSINRLLRNNPDPAHPSSKVSEGTLLEAFSTMKADQAAFLMRALAEEESPGSNAEDPDEKLEMTTTEEEQLVVKSSCNVVNFIAEIKERESRLAALEELVQQYSSATNSNNPLEELSAMMPGASARGRPFVEDLLNDSVDTVDTQEEIDL